MKNIGLLNEPTDFPITLEEQNEVLESLDPKLQDMLKGMLDNGGEIVEKKGEYLVKQGSAYYSLETLTDYFNRIEKQRLLKSVVIKDLDALSDEELNELSDIYKNSLNDNLDLFIALDDPLEDIKKMKEKGIKLSVFFVDNQVVGMGGLKDIYLDETLSETDVEICKLHLKEGYKGKGLGKKMTLDLMQKAREEGYKKMILHTTLPPKDAEDQTFTPAINLYKHLGFQVNEEATEKSKNNPYIHPANGQAFPSMHMYIDL